ncbi:MAG TPA: ABC transporter permease [Actinomycetota bacterium]|nr:ABC transporter permease [Actinomycetota bacterium]
MTTADATLRRRPVAEPRTARWRTFLSNPWGKPRFLSVWTWLYIFWTIAPVLIAVQFSFNDGRSRSTFQGFSTQWYDAIWDEASENYDDTLLPALLQSLKLALLTMPIATVLGVGLAIGLARWRGRGAGPANFLMLFPLVTPEIVMGASMFLIFSNLYHIRLGTTAQLLGHVTFSISYVVIVTRGRLFAVGKDYEEAAMDLGASPGGALRRVLLPLLAPAILSSFFIVFAISIDDFVISQFLCAQDCVTIPIKIYSAARNAGNPSLNALATIMMLLSLISITVAVLILRRFNKRESSGRSAVEDFARFEI